MRRAYWVAHHIDIDSATIARRIADLITLLSDLKSASCVTTRDLQRRRSSPTAL